MDVKDIFADVYDVLFETLLAGIIANKVKLLSALPFGDKVLQYKE